MGISLWFKKFESPNLRDEEVFKKKKKKAIVISLFQHLVVRIILVAGSLTVEEF